jgi:predicted CopG family antitoxin
MCMNMCKHMTSKNISITEDVYNKLMKIKGENESFSDLFLRLLNIQKKSLEKSFGAWKLSEKEKKEVWNDIITRPGRIWNKSNLGDIK